jgi:membrane-associated phospholipid phosphatase/tRNA A-37 threonylcarbamoyl transferase component Bud32
MVEATSMQRPRARHGSDVLRLVLGMVVLAVAALPVRPDTIGRVETGAFDLVNGLPGWLFAPVWGVMQLGALGAVPAVAVVALVLRRRRLALDLAVAGGLAWLAARFVKDAFDRPRPGGLLDLVVHRGPEAVGLGFVSGHTAVAVALATAASPHLPRPWRRVVWAAAAVVGLSRIYVGAHLPLDVVGGAGLGWAIGALLHLALGTPTGRPEAERIRAGLADLGAGIDHVEPVAVPAEVSAVYRGRQSDGNELLLKGVWEELPDRDLIYRLWRRLSRRRMKDEQRFREPRAQADHEAAIALAAERAGVRTPPVRFTRSLPGGLAVLATQFWPGADLTHQATLAATDLTDAWRQLARLHAAGLAHGSPVRENLLQMPDGIALVDFGTGAMLAEQRLRDEDIAELLVTLAVVAPTVEVVAAAVGAFGRAPIEAALARRDGIRWSVATRRDLAGRPDILDRLADAFAGLPTDRAVSAARTGSAGARNPS